MATTPSLLNPINGQIEGEALIDAVMRMPPGERVGGPKLKPNQEAALTALASGCTINEAAQLAGVHRNTASRWFNHDPAFRTVLDNLCDQMRQESHVRLRNTASEACRVVEEAVFGGNVAVSLQVLRAMGSFEAAKPRPMDSSRPATEPSDDGRPPAAADISKDKHQSTNKFQPTNRISRIDVVAPVAAFHAMWAGFVVWLAQAIGNWPSGRAARWRRSFAIVGPSLVVVLTAFVPS